MLDFEEDRLLRQVVLRQEVYLTLRRELETVEELNDMPVITVIDQAVAPVFRWLHVVSPEGLAEELAAISEERTSAGRPSCPLGDFTWNAVARRLDQVYAAVR